MDESNVEPYSWIMENEDMLRGVLFRSCGFCDAAKIDDLFGDIVVDFVPNIIARFDPSRGVSLWSWVAANVRLLVLDWKQEKLTRWRRVELLPTDADRTLEAVKKVIDGVIMRDETLHNLRAMLSAEEFRAAYLYYGLEYSQQEIAEKLRCSASKVRNLVSAALQKSRGGQ